MNAYQRRCYDETSCEISKLFDTISLAESQDLNSIIVSNINLTIIADVVVLSCACGVNKWQDTARLIQRIDPQLESIPLSTVSKRVMTICKHVKKQFCSSVSVFTVESVKTLLNSSFDVYPLPVISRSSQSKKVTCISFVLCVYVDKL